MTMKPRLGLLALGLILVLPAAASGQDEGQEQEAGPQTPPPLDTRLVFEREVFSYPTFDRRNPFRTLLSSEDGPRFEQMRLEMILLSDEPGESIALLSAGRIGAPASAEGTVRRGETHRLRVGERWGNVRVIEIRETEIVVSVDEFGITEQRIMQLPTRGQGGSR